MFGRVLIALVRFYQVAVSSWTAGACRFTPTCSGYAIEALERYGALRGSWRSVRRIFRCHPWGGWGYDPVPRGPAPDERVPVLGGDAHAVVARRPHRSNR